MIKLTETIRVRLKKWNTLDVKENGPNDFVMTHMNESTVRVINSMGTVVTVGNSKDNYIRVSV